MGRILNGILGPVHGKVGGVQGGSWKGIAYLKAYTRPSNPNTTDQQLQRNRFSAAVALTQAVYTALIEKFWNPFAVKMSGFNSFMSANTAALAVSTYYPTTSNKMALGTLEAVKTLTATLAAAVVTFVWDESIIGNGLLTDSVDLVVINKETLAVYTNMDTETRDDEGGTVTCTGETDPTKLLAFAIAHRGTGTSFVCSDSESYQVTAP